MYAQEVRGEASQIGFNHATFLSSSLNSSFLSFFLPKATIRSERQQFRRFPSEVTSTNVETWKLNSIAFVIYGIMRQGDDASLRRNARLRHKIFFNYIACNQHFYSSAADKFRKRHSSTMRCALRDVFKW